MNYTGFALPFSRPLHLDQTKRPDVFARLRLVLARLFFEKIASFRRGEQHLLPIDRRVVVQVQVELDHPLAFQRRAFHVHQEVRALRRRRRKLHDHARVEAFDRLSRELAVSLLTFVEND